MIKESIKVKNVGALKNVELEDLKQTCQYQNVS